MAKEKKIVEVNEADIADIELVNEVPADAEVVDEVVIVQATGRFQEDRNVR